MPYKLFYFQKKIALIVLVGSLVCFESIFFIEFNGFKVLLIYINLVGLKLTDCKFQACFSETFANVIG